MAAPSPSGPATLLLPIRSRSPGLGILPLAASGLPDVARPRGLTSSDLQQVPGLHWHVLAVLLGPVGKRGDRPQIPVACVSLPSSAAARVISDAESLSNGIVGCDDMDSRVLSQSEGGCAMPRSIDPRQRRSSCPSSGFYNVMKAPVDPAGPFGTVNVAVSLDPNATYPVSETVAFPYTRRGLLRKSLHLKYLAAEVTVIPSKTRRRALRANLSLPASRAPCTRRCMYARIRGWTQACGLHHPSGVCPSQSRCRLRRHVLDSCNRVGGTSVRLPSWAMGTTAPAKSPPGTLWPEPVAGVPPQPL